MNTLRRNLQRIIAIAVLLSAQAARADSGASRTAGGSISTGTLNQAAASAADQLLCPPDSMWRRCFPKIRSNCSLAFRADIDACAAAEKNRMGERASSEEFSAGMKFIFVCALERLLKSPPDQIEQSSECRAFIDSTRSNLQEQRKRGFRSDPEATVPASMILSSLSDSLTKVRCNEAVVRACYKVDTPGCRKLLTAVVKECSSALSERYPGEVKRDQGGEIGRELDACASGKFLPLAVSDPEGPSAECKAAMKAAW